MDIKTLWNSKEQADWENALQHYYDAVKSENLPVEEKINAMTEDDFRNMFGRDLYSFLLRDYSQWKYTDGRIRPRVRNSIEGFHQIYGDSEFNRVLEGIFAIDPDDIVLHLMNITRINGIGPAGASGVLSLVFPQFFGTVDRVAVENLQKVYAADSFYGKKLHRMDPENISVYDAAEVIRIYREKAEELWSFGGWTPRMVDMVLWSRR